MVEESAEQADGPKKIKAVPLLFLAIALFVCAFAWLFWGDALYENALKTHWPKWFGKKWFEGPEILYPMITAICAAGPPFLFFGIGTFLGLKFASLNANLRHRTNLEALSQARKALRLGLESVEEIERDYKRKLSDFEKLQDQLTELASVKEINIEDLRLKLSAISLANRRSLWFERCLGFGLGVVASLIATVIWEKVVRLI